MSDLTPKQVEELREYHASGASNRTIGKMFDVHHTTIGRILRGVSKLPSPPTPSAKTEGV